MKEGYLWKRFEEVQQNGEARLGYGEGLDEQLAEWSAELFRDPQYHNTWAGAQHHWSVESAARTRLIIKKQLREEIEQEMAKELGLPANWRGNKLKSLAEWHEKMACLAKADAAPRCEHVFQDGTRCGSPRMKSGELCYAHERMAKVRPRKLNLVPMEDANAIMLNIMEINRALVDEEITEKRAGMLLYSQQLGLQALGKLTFQKTRPEEMVRLEEIAADQRREAQIGGEEVSRERTRMSTKNEGQDSTTEDTEGTEDFAADQRRKAQIRAEEFATDEHGRAQIGEELSEVEEGGMNELSPVNDGMRRTGEGLQNCQNRRDCQRVKIGGLTLERAESAEKEEVAADLRIQVDLPGQEENGNCLGDDPLPLCPSHDLKDLEERSHRSNAACAG